MSTPFDVRRWAEQAGIQTTGGFAVVAECVTLDELKRFADIAIATAAKHWQRAHAIAALAMAERQEMSTPFNPEWLKPGAAVEVSMDNLAAYHAEVQRLMEENAALRAALAEPDEDDALTAAYMLGRYDSKAQSISTTNGVMGPTGWEKP